MKYKISHIEQWFRTFLGEHLKLNMSAAELFTHFTDKETCMRYLTEIRWGGNVQCVYCDCNKIYTLNGVIKRFKCANCRKQFSALKGTYMENSPVPIEKWFVAMGIYVSSVWILSNGNSMHLSREIKVTQTTAYYMMVRIRLMMGCDSLESNEFVIMKGMKQLNITP